MPLPELPKADYGQDQIAHIASYEKDIEQRFAKKQKRLVHSLGVGRCAEGLACLYDVDPYLSRVSGILHDWDKVYKGEAIIARARDLGIDMGVDLALVEPLLHGLTATHELACIYPELDARVLQAIERHTIAAKDMSPLDMVVFVADGIEPNRPGSPEIERLRSLVGTASLDDLFWESFASGMAYVINGGRYLYPGTVEIYNELALARRQSPAGK